MTTEAPLPQTQAMRDILVRLHPTQDPTFIDAFLTSKDYLLLTAGFETLMKKAMADFMANHIKPPSPAATETPAPSAVPASATPAALSPAPANATAPATAPTTAYSFRLPNARVGEAYAHALIILPADAPPPLLLDLALPPELGLQFNPATGQLSGCPKSAGQFDLNLRYGIANVDADSAADTEGQAQTFQAKITLFINADPRSLWKDLPSDTADPYWRPDIDAALLQGPQFSIIAASKRGRSHAHVGSFRDDDFAIQHLAENDWYCAVVADGAGSAKYARRGAQIVCQEVSQRLAASLNGIDGRTVEQATVDFYAARTQTPPDPVRQQETHRNLHHKLYQTVGYAAYHAVKAIHDEIAARPQMAATAKDFSTTALIAACRRFPFGSLCVAYWVGDGAVGIYRKTDDSKTGSITLLGDVDSGEFSGQTRFLDQNDVTQEAILRRTRFELVDDFTALMLMTDGVSDPKFDTESKLAQVTCWDALWHELEHEAGLPSSRAGVEQRLLSWLDFWSTGNHDDRTIALIY